MNTPRVFRRAVPLLLLAALAGCEQPQDLSVLIKPGSVTVGTFRKQQFTATVTGAQEQGVTWSVQEGAAGGTIDPNGLYTAPATPGTYTVIATTRATPTTRASVGVTVVEAPPEVSVSITPAVAQVGKGKSTTFAAEVIATAGTASDTSVTWSIQEGAAGGSISAQGVYTAPSTAGEYHVVATSNANPEGKASARVTVVEGISVQVSSAELGNLVAGGTRTFTATVTGTTDTRVVWSVEGEDNGTIDQDGVYTAPDRPGHFVIAAASRADETRKGTIGVTVVTPPEVSVSLTPASATLNGGDTLAFSATVRNVTDTSVTWSVKEGAAAGSITPDGVYTAPMTGGTYTVVATSNAVPSKAGEASVTVRPVRLTVAPENPSVEIGEQLELTATVDFASDTSVTWQVVEAGGGTLSSSSGSPVTYTAPAAPGRYTVRVTSVQDPSTVVDTVVTVFDPVAPSITVSPTSATLAAGMRTTLTATVTNSSDTVTWSVPQGAGTLTPNPQNPLQATYTAPMTGGTFDVTVALSHDAATKATANLTVVAPYGVGLLAHYAADLYLGVGVDLPSTNAHAVADWKDLSGNLRHLSQTTATKQPVFNPATTTAPATITFDGRDDVFVGPLLPNADAQPNTIFLVYRAISKPTTYVDSPAAAGGNRHRVKTSDRGGTFGWTLQMYAGGFPSVPPISFPEGTVVRSIHQFNGTLSKQRLEGWDGQRYDGWSASSSVNYSQLGTGGLGGIQLGLRQDLTPDNATTSGTADIIEVLFYDSALDTAQLAQVESYLSLKYPKPTP